MQSVACGIQPDYFAGNTKKLTRQPDIVAKAWRYTQRLSYRRSDLIEKCKVLMQEWAHLCVAMPSNC
jgi:hypothetical protein